MLWRNLVNSCKVLEVKELACALGSILGLSLPCLYFGAQHLSTCTKLRSRGEKASIIGCSVAVRVISSILSSFWSTIAWLHAVVYYACIKMTLMTSLASRRLAASACAAAASVRMLVSCVSRASFSRFICTCTCAFTYTLYRHTVHFRAVQEQTKAIEEWRRAQALR